MRDVSTTLPVFIFSRYFFKYIYILFLIIFCLKTYCTHLMRQEQRTKWAKMCPYKCNLYQEVTIYILNRCHIFFTCLSTTLNLNGIFHRSQIIFTNHKSQDSRSRKQEKDPLNNPKVYYSSCNSDKIF